MKAVTLGYEILMKKLCTFSSSVVVSRSAVVKDVKICKVYVLPETTTDAQRTPPSLRERVVSVALSYVSVVVKSNAILSQFAV